MNHNLVFGVIFVVAVVFLLAVWIWCMEDLP